MPAQILVPCQVVLPRRGVVAQVALVLLHLPAVDVVDVLLKRNCVRPELTPWALVAPVIEGLSDVPAELLVPIEVVLPR